MGPQPFTPTWTLSGLLTDYLYSLSSPLMLSPYSSQGGLYEGHLQNGFSITMPPLTQPIPVQWLPILLKMK